MKCLNRTGCTKASFQTYTSHKGLPIQQLWKLTGKCIFKTLLNCSHAFYGHFSSGIKNLTFSQLSFWQLSSLKEDRISRANASKCVNSPGMIPSQWIRTSLALTNLNWVLVLWEVLIYPEHGVSRALSWLCPLHGEGLDGLAAVMACCPLKKKKAPWQLWWRQSPRKNGFLSAEFHCRWWNRLLFQRSLCGPTALCGNLRAVSSLKHRPKLHRQTTWNNPAIWTRSLCAPVFALAGAANMPSLIPTSLC